MELGRGCIVAGVDFSEGALNALREARWLAKRANLPFQVVHVCDDVTSWSWDGRARSWLQTASLAPSGIIVRQGLAAVEIVRHAREVSAAVIVVGSHGASGVQSIALGSTSSRIALGAPCPVLLVPRWRESLPSREAHATTT